MEKQTFVGAFVVYDCFCKAILAMENIADIYFQARQPPWKIQARENIASAFGCVEGADIFTEQNQRLNGRAESSSGFIPFFQFSKQIEGALVMFRGGAIIARGIERICFRAKAEREGSLVVQ